MAYAERMRDVFRLSEMRDYYVQRGHMSRPDFYRLLSQTMAIRALEEQDLDWSLLDHVLSVTEGIPFHEHLSALSAGVGIEFTTVEKFYEELIDKDLVPPSMLNRTVFYGKPDPTRPLGDLLISVGLCDDRDVERANAVQARIHEATSITPSTLYLMRSLAPLSVCDFFQILGLRVGVPFQSLNASASAIYDARISVHTGSFRTLS